MLVRGSDTHVLAGGHSGMHLSHALHRVREVLLSGRRSRDLRDDDQADSWSKQDIETYIQGIIRLAILSRKDCAPAEGGE